MGHMDELYQSVQYMAVANAWPFHARSNSSSMEFRSHIARYHFRQDEPIIVAGKL